jgi:hypothetical protein
MADPRCATTTPLEVHELSNKEHRSVQYIETADASVYPKVCYYPVTEGSRPVECVPPVEEGPKTNFDLRANSKMSAAVRLNPTELNGVRHPRAEFATLFGLQQVGGICQQFTSVGRRRTKVWRYPTHFSRVRCLRRGARMRLLATALPEGDARW